MKVLAILAVIVAAVAAASCPKETVWQFGQCYGADGPHENIENVQMVLIDRACCQCPSRKRLFKSAGSCFFRARWGGKRVQVASSCCEGTHFERPSHRQDHHEDKDAAADYYRLVTGHDFFRTGRSPLSFDAASGDACATAIVNVRKAPNTAGAVVRRTKVGERFSVIGRSPDKAWLQFSDGWAAAQYFNPCVAAGTSVSAPARPSVVETNTAPRPAGSPNGLCPLFYKIWEGYPGHDVASPELLARIGFGSWVTNTCAIRTTLGLVNANISPGDIGRSRFIGKGKRYLIRVAEMEQFMKAHFGAPYVVTGLGVESSETDEQGNKIFKADPKLNGKAGVIQFSECGWSDATGHFDVWDGANIRNHAYFNRCKRAVLYNVCTPIARPNYDAFRAYIARTQK